MNKIGFTMVLVITGSIQFAWANKPTFESIFGEYAKAYYEFNYVKRSRNSVEKMEKAVKSTNQLNREERAKVITLLIIKFEPDGEAGHIFRKVIRENNDVDFLLLHTKALLENPNASKTNSEKKNLDIFISFLNSIKKYSEKIKSD